MKNLNVSKQLDVYLRSDKYLNIYNDEIIKSYFTKDGMPVLLNVIRNKIYSFIKMYLPNSNNTCNRFICNYLMIKYLRNNLIIPRKKDQNNISVYFIGNWIGENFNGELVNIFIKEYINKLEFKTLHKKEINYILSINDEYELNKYLNSKYKDINNVIKYLSDVPYDIYQTPKTKHLLKVIENYYNTKMI